MAKQGIRLKLACQVQSGAQPEPVAWSRTVEKRPAIQVLPAGSQVDIQIGIARREPRRRKRSVGDKRLPAEGTAGVQVFVLYRNDPAPDFGIRKRGSQLERSQTLIAVEKRCEIDGERLQSLPSVSGFVGQEPFRVERRVAQ